MLIVLIGSTVARLPPEFMIRVLLLVMVAPPTFSMTPPDLMVMVPELVMVPKMLVIV